MITTILNTSEDMTWLFETHLKRFAGLWTAPAHDRLHKAFVAAILHGNEDCPDTIDLLSRDAYDAPVLRFGVSDDGQYYVVGMRPQE